jgi:hypothetical protein
MVIDDSMSSRTNSAVSACFRLGWRVEELHRRFDVPEHLTYDDQTRLPGLSKLTPDNWQQLGLDQVDFVVSQVTAKVGRPTTVPLNLTTDARNKLKVIHEADRATRCGEYRTALSELDVNLLITLTAADSSYGKAYDLGRALADTTRPQEPDQLHWSFENGRIERVYIWLDELASLLPEHAARTVSQSLVWWKRAVEAAAEGSQLSASSMPASYRSKQASRQARWKRTAAALRPRRHRTQDNQVDPPCLKSLAAAVVRQGALWRGVLDGDKLCTDLLRPQDYLCAGDRLAHHNATLVGRVLRTMPWLLLLPLSFVGVVLVLLVIPGSPIARTATGIAAFAGTLSGIWRAIRARVIPIAMQLEEPLWGSELDIATAEAVTIPPVGGPRDPVWESDGRHAAAEVTAAATPLQKVRTRVPNDI